VGTLGLKNFSSGAGNLMLALCANLLAPRVAGNRVDAASKSYIGKKKRRTIPGQKNGGEGEDGAHWRCAFSLIRRQYLNWLAVHEMAGGGQGVQNSRGFPWNATLGRGKEPNQNALVTCQFCVLRERLGATGWVAA